ncbi:glucooligosaccharide oxidase protein [Purpureocillium lavendulum]|uniref:Glucooligosaccharide oxidase protein n=1 Tax=Purpureocillium lavendulum TaxID=1247861 RepID=A0AB34FDM0_9HYPO|nr:glucooligosaccharide oxidase protein [Purpureocillium lavendulum]
MGPVNREEATGGTGITHPICKIIADDALKDNTFHNKGNYQFLKCRSSTKSKKRCKHDVPPNVKAVEDLFDEIRAVPHDVETEDFINTLREFVEITHCRSAKHQEKALKSFDKWAAERQRARCESSDAVTDPAEELRRSWSPSPEPRLGLDGARAPPAGSAEEEDAPQSEPAKQSSPFPLSGGSTTSLYSDSNEDASEWLSEDSESEVGDDFSDTATDPQDTSELTTPDTDDTNDDPLKDNVEWDDDEGDDDDEGVDAITISDSVSDAFGDETTAVPAIEISSHDDLTRLRYGESIRNVLRVYTDMDSPFTNSHRKHGIVYILRHVKEPHLFKIGWSVRGAEHRRCENCYGSDSEVIYETDRPFFAAYRAEQMAQAMLVMDNLLIACDMCEVTHREWFRSSKRKVLKVVKIAESFIRLPAYTRQDGEMKLSPTVSAAVKEMIKFKPAEFRNMLLRAPQEIISINAHRSAPAVAATAAMSSNPYYGARDRDAEAPEVAQVSSPLTAISNLEGEWQRQYQWTRDAERPPMPSGDTAKEAFNNEPDAKYVVPLELKSEYPETATSITSPQTTAVPWTPDSERLQPVLSNAPRSPGSLHSSITGGHGGGGGGSPVFPPPVHGGAAGGEPNEKKNGKILGMSRKAFIILIVVVIIIVAAAVGGGVGGAVASKSKSDAAPVTTSSSVPSSTPPPSTTSSAPTSTSANPSASATPNVKFLNNETWPQGYVHAFQGFSRANYSGSATEIFTDEGAHDFQFDLHSYVWMPNIGNCCASLCANGTKQGWLGYRCEPTKRLDASDPIARVFVWCNNNHTIEFARGKCS